MRGAVINRRYRRCNVINGRRRNDIAVSVACIDRSNQWRGVEGTLQRAHQWCAAAVVTGG